VPNLCEFNQCCGCSACFAACPKAAIVMQPDKEGFLRPQISTDKCVDCKLCEKACPVLNRPMPRRPLAVYAAKAKDDALRMQSSSGGIFSLLARQVFAKGGIVYGAAIRKDDLMVYHCSAENEEELSRLRGSKYVQSEMGDTYRQVKEQLAAGRFVMFTGTPCQIAGLRAYLGREYDNLLCVDVICHAAPSPLAWQKYLEARAAEIKGRGSAPAEVFDYRRISFRRKNCGWKRYALSLGYASDKAYLGYLGEDLFLRGFLSELYNRSSCYHCSFRDLRSGSDLTIADYWGVAKKFPGMDDDKGCSVVLVNTQKGVLAFDSIQGNCVLSPSDFDDIKKNNPAVAFDCSIHSRRDRFFRLVQKGIGFNKAFQKVLQLPVKTRTRVFLGRIWQRIFVKVK